MCLDRTSLEADRNFEREEDIDIAAFVFDGAQYRREPGAIAVASCPERTMMTMANDLVPEEEVDLLKHSNLSMPKNSHRM
jgi:hypothetical protein